MKYIIFVLTLLMTVSAFAQDDMPVKLDGTKYYLQVYDGVSNEKVVYYNPNGPGWTSLINVADYFDGSDAQLWSFEESPNFPGYFLVRNRDESVFSTHSLMSWNWNAYLAKDEDRPPLNEMEKQFRFVEAFDGYYILETIEKPTDGSLYGVNYTPGADAMNVNDNGVISFRDVKSADITRANMANKVFKIVEFNPLKLFEDAITRGDDLYNANPDAPEKVRYDFFYQLEKAREIRVFGTDAQILAHQPVLDSVTNLFNTAVGTVDAIDDAKTFIDTVAVDAEIKESFNIVVEGVEEFINDENLIYSTIPAMQEKLDAAITLINAIVVANDSAATLSEADSLLVSGIETSVENAAMLLANTESTTAMFSDGVTHLEATQAVIDQVLIANDTIAGTEGFEESKEVLTAVLDEAIALINTQGTPSADINAAVEDLENAIKAYIRSLQAGDVLLELRNGGFDEDFANWIVDSPTPNSAYAEDRGIDKSRSITCYGGSAYQMKVYQSLTNIPNGTYIISFLYRNSDEGSYGLFGESGTNSVDFPLPAYNNGNYDLTPAEIEIEVVDGTLRFGVRGQGENNGVPGGKWVLFDEFEVKLSASVPLKNGGFDEDFANWIVDSPTPNSAYAEDRGIEKSRSITCYGGSAYQMKVYQTINIPNGTYKVSFLYRNSDEGSYGLFAESGSNSVDLPLPAYNIGNYFLTKAEIEVEVTDGILSFGVRGQGENNGVPAGKWVLFDEFEVTRLPDIPVANGGFDADFANWIVDSPTPNAAYAEDRGIEKSRSITCYGGSAYQMKVYQSVSNMLNGTYNISFLYRNSDEGSYGLFAESGTNIVDLPLPAYNIGNYFLTPADIDITVMDGVLDFGVRGQGEDNGVPGGKWVLFDEFNIKIKTIVPDYVEVTPSPSENFITNIDDQRMSNEITYWQSNQRLNIRSSTAIVKYAVYSITGAVVEQNESYTTTLSIPMQRGIYVVRVLTEDGTVDTEKVSIR